VALADRARTRADPTQPSIRIRRDPRPTRGPPTKNSSAVQRVPAGLAAVEFALYNGIMLVATVVSAVAGVAGLVVEVSVHTFVDSHPSA
jgi:hypothetical protein